MPQHCNLCQCTGQVKHSRTFSGRGIQRYYIVFVLGENRTQQPGDLMAGTDLHKGTATRIIHLVNFSDEFNRPYDLVSQEYAGRLGGGWINIGDGICEDGDLASRKLDVFEGGDERLAGIGDIRAVKCRGHGETTTPETFGFQQHGGAIDFNRSAGEHGLIRRVLVGDDQIEGV